MTSSARAEADCKEYFDPPDVLQTKIKKLAALIKKSNHFVAFTGAGISTSAGIADFRSGINTVLDTGAGKWAKNAAVQQGKKVRKGKRNIDMMKAYPTSAHMALIGLQQHQYLKYLISQNTDGLHRRSGFPIDKLSELHGNRKLEVCDKCNKAYMRDYCCRESLRKQKAKDHFTGRLCTVKKCNGKLHDTIINFGETLHEIPLKRGNQEADKCDVMLCLGSSLTVYPAANLPKKIGIKSKKEFIKKHHLVIVNLQITPLHELCSLAIFAKIDDVMIGLMKELELKIPKWYLPRYIKLCVKQLKNNNDFIKMIVYGVDRDGTKFTLFNSVKLRNSDGVIAGNQSNDEFVYLVPIKSLRNGDDEGITMKLSFFGNYNEPDLSICLNDYLNDELKENDEIIVKMIFDPRNKIWNVPNKIEQMKEQQKHNNVNQQNDDEKENDDEIEWCHIQ